jgi:hypothetical protein
MQYVHNKRYKLLIKGMRRINNAEDHVCYKQFLEDSFLIREKVAGVCPLRHYLLHSYTSASLSIFKYDK